MNYYTFLLDPKEIEVVSGKQVTIDKVTGEMYGADFLGERWAKENGYPIKEFEADWDRYGLPAGPIRNKEMADYGTHLVAFHDGKSKGTRDMIECARAAGLKVRVVKY